MELNCACKGIRTCLVCENYKPKEPLCSNVHKFNEQGPEKKYVYCDSCKKAWLPSDEGIGEHPNHLGESIELTGIDMIKDFVTEDEEEWLRDQVDKTAWVDSQSGRRKQDYGPKVNFKKHKLKMSVFSGMPSLSRMLVDRMSQHSVLSGFVPVELCNLEYTPERGSSIDPHFDDFWIWGDRLVTLNLLSATVHTMTMDSLPGIEVAVALPRRCLVVVGGDARYKWKHGIHRFDITSRRLAMTFRELPPAYLSGGEHAEVGAELVARSLTFNGSAVGTGDSQKS
ncbi:Alkylated DNA repair protein alkB-like protein 4 [Lamellibrachia satsuma]|nr:Alkylated DNA repair protein alkB-like protein 4 [Lamellibrachia satsuma]